MENHPALAAGAASKADGTGNCMGFDASVLRQGDDSVPRLNRHHRPEHTIGGQALSKSAYSRLCQQERDMGVGGGITFGDSWGIYTNAVCPHSCTGVTQLAKTVPRVRVPLSVNPDIRDDSLEARNLMMRGFQVVKDSARKHAGEIVLPKRATSGSAGYDFITPCDVTLIPGRVTIVWTDVKAYMRSNEMLKLYIRSSFGKKHVMLANGTGIVDSDYYENPDNDGNIGIMLVYSGDPDSTASEDVFQIKAGERIAQGIFESYLLKDEDEEINPCVQIVDEPTPMNQKTRIGGFGSTGVE